MARLPVSRLVVGLLLASAGLGVAQAQAPTRVVTATISGQVLALQLAQVGQVVHLGDPLVFVRTATGGAVPTARAPVDGRVVQVFVRPGDRVNIGDPVVELEPQ